ncbi:MAG: histidine phosphatase family protein [Aureispira sp.]|nr:histidine phosphatase family protein [Aureispira sp.]
MLKLYFIRHAQGKNNVNPNIISGHSKAVLLTAKGRKQARALGKRLDTQNVKFDEVYCSPTTRTKETAELACGFIRIFPKTIQYSDELIEVSKGDWEGKHRAVIYTPEVKEAMQADPYGFCPPNGENMEMVEKRVYEWIETTLLPKADQNLKIGIFTHSFVIKSVFRKLMKADRRTALNITINNTSITRFNYDSAKGWILDHLNDDGHLKLTNYWLS